MTTGQRIAQKRKELELSQEALGAELGVSRQSIYKWESDAALPEIDKLVALSRRFGVTVGWLLGVEDAAEPPAGESGELTDMQLKMVEEIVARYREAKPVRRRRWPWVLLVLLLLVAGNNLSHRLDEIKQQYNGLQYAVYDVTDQIDSISNRVETILKAQNSLAADYGSEIAASNLAANTVTFSVYAVPRTYVEGLSVEFIAENGTETSSMVGRAVESTDRRFSATVSIHLTDSISLSALFVYPDGTQQTQLLDTYSYLYTNSMSMDANIVDSDLQGKASYENGVLTLLPTDFAAEVIQYDDSVLPETASPASVKLGLFKNRQLIAWAEELDAQPDSFHGFEGYTFYCTPKSYVPCTRAIFFQRPCLSRTNSAGSSSAKPSPAPMCWQRTVRWNGRRTITITMRPFPTGTSDDSFTAPPPFSEAGLCCFLYITFFEILPEFLRIAVVFRRIACYHTGKQQSAEFFMCKS